MVIRVSACVHILQLLAGELIEIRYSQCGVCVAAGQERTAKSRTTTTR